MEAALVENIRKSSRALVRALGFLRPSLAGTTYPPSGVHALIEVGQNPSITIAQLGRVLDLDKSTASRLVQKLVSTGELELRTNATDGREKLLRLTSQGKVTLERINRFGDDQVAEALRRLPRSQHTVLERALESYARALDRASAPLSGRNAWVAVGYRSGLVARVTELHSQYYREFAGFGLQFEAAVAAGLADFVTRLDNPMNQIWTIDQDGEVLGSIAIDGEDLGGGTAHLRWFIVDCSLRGKGLGKELIQAAIDHCRKNRFSRIALWTLPGLSAAQKLYRSEGFEQTEVRQGAQWGESAEELKFVLELS